MVPLYSFHLVAQVTVSGPESATHAIADDFDGPASAPTMLVEDDGTIGIPTALPAPPLVPTYAGDSGWHPPPSGALPGARRPALALVRAPQPSARSVVRGGESLRRIGLPSTPPSVPPPPRAMRRAA